MMTFFRCAIVALMLTPAPAVAQDFDAGWAAYETGDYATALREWRPLAEQGLMSAQFNLAQMYFQGRGVVQDYAGAVSWYRLAAEQGSELAQFNLAQMYRLGQGVEQDYAVAWQWYRLAAEQGHAVAQSNLGVMYYQGRGVLQDHMTAHMWFNIAAANGGEGASEKRDIAASKLTAEAIVEAQQRARTCMASDYQDCEPPRR